MLYFSFPTRYGFSSLPVTSAINLRARVWYLTPHTADWWCSCEVLPHRLGWMLGTFTPPSPQPFVRPSGRWDAQGQLAWWRRQPRLLQRVSTSRSFLTPPLSVWSAFKSLQGKRKNKHARRLNIKIRQAHDHPLTNIQQNWTLPSGRRVPN